MSREMLKNLIDLVPHEDIETLYKVIIKFIPEEMPMQDEKEAIALSEKGQDTFIPHNAVNWD